MSGRVKYPAKQMAGGRGGVGFLVAVFLVAAVVVPGAWAEGPGIGLIYAEAKLARLEKGETDPQRAYRDAIEMNGGRVVVLGQGRAHEEIVGRLADIDGVVLPGGIDVCPALYGETPHEALGKTDAGLDRLEFEVLGFARAHGLPVLGICRGHQVLNVFYGGSLIQDIPAQHESETVVVHRFAPVGEVKRDHAITIEAGSVLRELLGVDRMVVNTYHHQAVKRLAPGFRVTARTEDGLVEAMEREGDVFILGVQFHPEKMVGEDPRFNALFRKLVDEAAKKLEEGISNAKTRRRKEE